MCDCPNVKIEQGLIKGKLCKNYKGTSFYSFLGIPYAKPPVAELRFKAPEPAEPWTGVKNCTKRHDCYQKDPERQDIFPTEDCLVLNVYTRELPGCKKHLKPVMVYIHGGGFVFGASYIHNPDYILEEDIVFVSINYRLGIFGFLCLEDQSLGVPGNAGMKDMVLALKWVQKNISEFSGDPNNVTIVGQSAGGAAVHFLTLSPLCKGLFHKAIAMSGCALNPWAVSNPNAMKMAAVNVGFSGKSDAEMLKFLRSLTAEELLSAQHTIKDLEQVACARILRPWALTVEKPSAEAFLPEQPIDIINSGKYMNVPLMIGFASEEGVMFAEPILKDESLLDNLQLYLPHNLPLCNSKLDEIRDEVNRVYLGKGTDGLHNLCSDILFLHGIHVTARKHMVNAPVYYYRFSMDSELNNQKRMRGISKAGALHAEDLCYLFRGLLSTPDFKPGSKEETHVARMIKLWTNFAKNGDPNPMEDIEWKPASKDALHYLEIGHELSAGTILPESERMAFWDKLFADVYKL